MSNVVARFDCSVVVCSYCSDWEKMRLTLKSILMQEQCNIQIVVADDGSPDNLFDRIKKYFVQHEFINYKLVTTSENRGTVYNILQGVYACVGEFVKPLSPGDCLHGILALHDWIAFMRSHRDCIMSFCDAIYYHMSDGKFVPLKEFAHPQSVDVYEGGTLSAYI